MKSISKLRMYGLAILILVSGYSINSFAQAGREFNRQGRGGMRASVPEELKLRDEQKAQLKDIRQAHQQVTKELGAFLVEKKAHLKTLLVVKDRNDNAIDKTIDEIAGLQAEQMKMRIKHQDDLSEVLTPEQMKMMQKRGMMTRKGRGQREGFDRPHRRGANFDRPGNNMKRFRR